MTDASLAHPRTRPGTRHHRCDERFIGLLEEDYGIDPADLGAAFLAGVPAPQRQSIELCEWATRVARDPEDAGRALRAWAKKNGRGAYDPRMLNAPPAGADE